MVALTLLRNCHRHEYRFCPHFITIKWRALRKQSLTDEITSSKFFRSSSNWWLENEIHSFHNLKKQTMKKVFITALVLMVSILATKQTTAQCNQNNFFELTTMPDSTKVLTVKGKPFTKTRIDALARAEVILMQPRETHLMLLSDNGSGGCLGKTDNRWLLIQDTKTKRWKLVADSYSLGKTIMGAYDPADDLPEITIFLQNTLDQEPERIFVKKP